MKDRIVPLDNALVKLLHHYKKQTRGQLHDEGLKWCLLFGPKSGVAKVYCLVIV